MDEHQYPSESTESGKDTLISAAGNLKEAAGAKAEDLRQAAGQKAEELRSAAQDKAQELRGAAESGSASCERRVGTRRRSLCSRQPDQGRIIAFGLAFCWVSLRK